MRNVFIFLLSLSPILSSSQTIKSISKSICDSIHAVKTETVSQKIQMQRAIYNYELVKYPTLIVDITDLNKPRQFNEFNYKINRELLRDCEGFIDQFSLLPLSKILDVEGIFTTQQFDSLERALVDFVFSKKMDLLVVTMDDPYPFDSFDDFAKGQINKWNVGRRYEKGGILMIISKKNNTWMIVPDAKGKFSLSSEKCKTVLETKGESHFEEGQFYKGVQSCIKELKGSF